MASTNGRRIPPFVKDEELSIEHLNQAKYIEKLEDLMRKIMKTHDGGGTKCGICKTLNDMWHGYSHLLPDDLRRKDED